jgi:hypothetical protein
MFFPQARRPLLAALAAGLALKMNNATTRCMCDGIGAPDRIELVD